jgi:hypothetical protein
MVSFAKVFVTAMPPLPLLMFNEHRNGKINPRNNSGSLAMPVAIRRASSLVSSLAADRQPQLSLCAEAEEN